MIPYFEQPSFALGPLTIYAFGVFAALGIFIGARIAERKVRSYSGLDPRPLADAVPWAVAGGILGGHLLHVLGYHPELLSTEGPQVLLRVWDGQSSMGGVLGGLGGFLAHFARHRRALFPYLDALALGVAPGWAVARLGCFVAHDHPGTHTDFFLAVAFPGGARHDLGLYEALVLGTLALILHVFARKRPPNGVLMGVLAAGYGTARFFLDFLRATDVPLADGRWLGLTPAQYLAFGALAVSAYLIARAYEGAVHSRSSVTPS